MRKVFATLLLFVVLPTFGQVLRIVSEPAGATVEIDGVVVGKTPLEQKVPGGYFHKTATVFGKRLGRPETATIHLDGYVTRSFELTRGPYPWTDLNGNSHGDFYLLKLNTFTVRLEKAESVFKTSIPTDSSSFANVSTTPSTSLADLVDKTSDSVLRIETEGGHGSGFLITRDGVAVTNRHVVTDSDQVVARTIHGQSFNGTVVYRDSDLDLALIKLSVENTPALTFANMGSARVGSDAIAIGNPAQGMQNSVTRGIVSGIGPEPDYGPGQFIQTDAAINPGNSGGPLLDVAGHVIGMNTFKAVRSNSGSSLQSLGFAISSESILNALRKTFPNSQPAAVPAPLPLQRAHLALKSNVPEGDIYVDGKFVGNMGTTLSISAGDHNVEVRSKNFKTWQRNISVNADDSINLSAVLEPQ